MPDTHIFCVGAVYIDTILTIPHFPIEDTKLRATNLTRRRGGNTANSLEVLAQLLPPPAPHEERLHLVSVLPAEDSDAARFIGDSLPGVDFSGYAIWRTRCQDAASSYILHNEQNHSRTIVSINELGEMTTEEFVRRIGEFDLGDFRGDVWVHFEGRIPDVTLECIKYLRQLGWAGGLKISVECEKPERKGMMEVAREADVVFYSRLWAEENGFHSAEDFLTSQLSSTREGALLCCTWGSQGATAVQKWPLDVEETVKSQVWETVISWHPDDIDARPVDSIGAGDTFIAGMIYGITNHPERTLKQKLQYANELAGRKVYQNGFAGLGQKMKESAHV